MKIALIAVLFGFSISIYASGHSIEIGLSSGSLEDENISSTHLQYTYTPDTVLFNALGGNFGYALGLRSTSYQADLFQSNSDDKSEFLEDVSVTAHNIFGQIHYQRSFIQVGFNLDLIGFSSSTSANIEGTNQEIDSQTFNLFLFAKNDQGTLNSQVFIKFDLNPAFIKAGLSHSLISFDDKGLSDDQSRQRFFDTACLSLGYKF